MSAAREEPSEAIGRPEAPAAGPGRTPYVLLGLLLALSLLLRVWLGSFDLHSGRFWDERYGLTNVKALLWHGSWKPAMGYHPGLSYLPHAAVLWSVGALGEALDAPALQVFDGRGRFTPTAYLVCRSFQAVLGILSLWLAFVIGRRYLASPGIDGAWVGLWAALLLSCVPRHLRQSAIYKPDALLMVTLLLALLVSIEAVRRGSARRYLAAGATIGLALATKFNAGPIAFPLTLGAALGALRARRHLLWLILAGTAALLVFLAFNPYILIEPEIYRRDFSRTMRDYARKGKLARSSHLYALWHAVPALLAPDLLGWAFGALGLAGLVLLAAAAWRARGSKPALAWAMIASYPPAYALFYAAGTTNPTAHSWLPVAPVVCLAAAWLLGRLWGWLATRRPALGRAPVLAALVLVLGAWRGTPAFRYAYEDVIPTTEKTALDRVRPRLAPDAPHAVYLEAPTGEVTLFLSSRRSAYRPLLAARAGGLKALGDDLPLADAVLFPPERLAGPDAGLYRAPLGEGDGEPQPALEPRPFRLRGPALAGQVRPLHPLGPPETLACAEVAGGVEGALPPALAGVVSIEVLAPPQRQIRSIRIGGREVAFASARRLAGLGVWVSERVRPGAGDVSVRVGFDEAPRRRRKPMRKRAQASRAPTTVLLWRWP